MSHARSASERGKERKHAKHFIPAGHDEGKSRHASNLVMVTKGDSHVLSPGGYFYETVVGAFVARQSAPVILTCVRHNESYRFMVGKMCLVPEGNADLTTLPPYTIVVDVPPRIFHINVNRACPCNVMIKRSSIPLHFT